MSNNGFNMAFPSQEDACSLGLTKREYMATHIMAGFAAAPGDDCPHTILGCAEMAIKWADKLLEELEK